MNKNLTSKCTPLRNSSLANRPFRSPIASLTPKSINKSSPLPSPGTRTATPKRPPISSEKPAIKKRRINVEGCEESAENVELLSPSKVDLLTLKKRIRSKRQEIEGLRAQLAYRRKHSREDLRMEMKKWREACQKALVDFQKDWNERNPEGVYCDMRKLMTMLNIPEEVVKFPDEADLT